MDSFDLHESSGRDYGVTYYFLRAIVKLGLTKDGSVNLTDCRMKRTFKALNSFEANKAREKDE